MTYINANKVPFNTGSNFCREGQFVVGNYYNQEFSGTVILSRVKYGSKIQHTIDLLIPIEVHGTERRIIICDEDEIEGAFILIKFQNDS